MILVHSMHLHENKRHTLRAQKRSSLSEVTVVTVPLGRTSS